MNSEWKNANTTIRIASDEAYRRALSSVRGPRPFVGSNYWQINCDNEVPGRRTVVLKQRFTESLFSSQYTRALLRTGSFKLCELTVYLLGRRIYIFVVVRVSIVFFVSRIPFRLFMANPKAETIDTRRGSVCHRRETSPKFLVNAKSKIYYETVENHRWKDINLLKIKKKYDMDKIVWKPKIIEISDISISSVQHYRDEHFDSFNAVFERFDIEKYRKSATNLKTGFL